MTYKYLLAVDQQPLIGMTFDDNTNILRIGGKMRSRFTIESIIEVSCGKDTEVHISTPQRNKIRYAISKTWEEFKEVIERLKDSGVIVTETEKLGRVMI